MFTTTWKTKTNTLHLATKMQLFKIHLEMHFLLPPAINIFLAKGKCSLFFHKRQWVLDLLWDWRLFRGKIMRFGYFLPFVKQFIASKMPWNQSRSQQYAQKKIPNLTGYLMPLLFAHVFWYSALSFMLWEVFEKNTNNV